MKLKPIREQTIVITGGSSGIGLATAQMAARQGAQVIVMSRSEGALRKVCEQIRAAGGRADYVVGDVGVRAEVRAAVDQIVQRFGGFDTWINDAGVAVYARLEEMRDEDHERMFQTNYWGVVYGSTEALRVLRQRGGALINVGSISSEMPSPILGGYTATKFAVKGFTDSLRLELMNEKAPVSVTLIQPASIHTPFGDHAKNYMDGAAQVPPPVYAPELVAKAILHAAAHPARSIVVGGAGRAMIWASRSLPIVADPFFSATFPAMTKDTKRPPQNDIEGFETAGSTGALYGRQPGGMRRFSLFTTMQTDPWKMTAATLGVGLAGAALAAWAMRPNGQANGSEVQRARSPEPQPGA